MRILIVEDQAPLMRLLSWTLLDAGFTVSDVATAEEATELLMNRLSPDVIVFNQALSPDDKRKFVELFHSLDARPKIIELKDHAAPVSEADVDAVLSTPFHAEDLIKTINTLVVTR